MKVRAHLLVFGDTIKQIVLFAATKLAAQSSAAAVQALARFGVALAARQLAWGKWLLFCRAAWLQQVRNKSQRTHIGHH